MALLWKYGAVRDERPRGREVRSAELRLQEADTHWYNQCRHKEYQLLDLRSYDLTISARDAREVPNRFIQASAYCRLCGVYRAATCIIHPILSQNELSYRRQAIDLRN